MSLSILMGNYIEYINWHTKTRLQCEHTIPWTEYPGLDKVGEAC